MRLRVKLKKFGRSLGETQAITCSMLQSSLDTHTTAATSLAAPAVHANGVTDFERHAVASLSTYLILDALYLRASIAREEKDYQSGFPAALFQWLCDVISGRAPAAASSRQPPPCPPRRRTTPLHALARLSSALVYTIQRTPLRKSRSPCRCVCKPPPLPATTQAQ